MRVSRGAGSDRLRLLHPRETLRFRPGCCTDPGQFLPQNCSWAIGIGEGMFLGCLENAQVRALDRLCLDL